MCILRLHALLELRHEESYDCASTNSSSSLVSLSIRRNLSFLRGSGSGFELSSLLGGIAFPISSLMCSGTFPSRDPEDAYEIGFGVTVLD
jgi:hypothetical protein